jgi:hypothetical protein
MKSQITYSIKTIMFYVKSKQKNNAANMVKFLRIITKTISPLRRILTKYFQINI